MKVVLIETVSNLGLVGDVINVRPGYARNFLLPNNKAIVASQGSIKQVEHQKKILAHKIKKAKAKALDVQKALKDETVIIKRKTGEGDRLFGSVNALDIEHALRDKGFSIGRKSIKLEAPFKKIGLYTVNVKLDQEVEFELSVKVAAEKE